jgi:hypothetical protein
MSVTNRALAWQTPLPQPETTVKAATSAHIKQAIQDKAHSQTHVPALRVMPLLRNPQPRRFVRVPTHAVGVHTENRECPRAALKLPLKLRSAAGVPEQYPITLVTRDISSSGVYFLCPKTLAPGTEIELDIVLVSRPLGYGNVVVSSKARVCRIEAANMPGWYGIAAKFEDFGFDRDDRIPEPIPAD